jgi:hypothetical protein
MKQSEALYSLVKQSDEGEKFGREYGWDLRSQVCDWRGVSCDDGVSVTKLDISGAGYSGSIPREFESLVTLKNLTLSHNKFIGLVPPQVAQLPALEVFDVLNNTLMGPLPIFDKNKSPKLQRVILQSNMFTHRLTPEWLKALPATTLTELNLSDNEITGSLPTEIGTLQELDTLDVSINAFYGTIPAQLANMPKLRFLYLNVNRFVGTIPRSISTSDRIFEEVWFQNNLLSGTIPADFAEMPNLLDFYVDGTYACMCIIQYYACLFVLYYFCCSLHHVYILLTHSRMRAVPSMFLLRFIFRAHRKLLFGNHPDRFVPSQH